MKHLGDITKINGADVAPVNVVIGGSPCQDLSVAGKRAGLAGERSGLFMEQLRVIKEMRQSDANNGRTGTAIRPRFMVWENVPGAFSSNKGADFGAVLQETVRVVCKEAPTVPMPSGGWPTAGCLVDVEGHWSVAWRVFDAQFWGVPQRRRRIALVADFGGPTAPEILFERESLSGNPETSGKEGKGPATGTEKSVAGASYAVRIRGGCDGGGKGALVQAEKSGTLGCNNDQTIFYAIGSYHSNAWKSDNPNSGVYETDVAKTLDAINCGYPGCNQGGTAIVASFKANNGAKARGIGYAIEQAPTLGAEAPVQAILDISHRNDVVREYSGVVPSLCARAGTGGNNVPCLFTSGQYGEYKQGCGTKRAAGGDLGGCRLPCVQQKRVRRLTPLECERLQGFPDGWTQIGEVVDCLRYEVDGEEYIEVVYEYTNSAGKRLKTTDSARYKALGNSIALPSWAYVLQKLSLCCGAEHTMASLFDGIGGFPLIWEGLHGQGSCLWASEIEEFPIAVTKERFPEQE